MSNHDPYRLTPVGFNDLRGWERDDPAPSFLPWLPVCSMFEM